MFSSISGIRRLTGSKLALGPRFSMILAFTEAASAGTFTFNYVGKWKVLSKMCQAWFAIVCSMPGRGCFLGWRHLRTWSPANGFRFSTQALLISTFRLPRGW